MAAAAAVAEIGRWGWPWRTGLLEMSGTAASIVATMLPCPAVADVMAVADVAAATVAATMSTGDAIAKASEVAATGDAAEEADSTRTRVMSMEDKSDAALNSRALMRTPKL